MAEKAFLGSLMKAEYLLTDTVIQPEQLESARHKEIMRKMVEFKRAGKNIDLITFSTLSDLESVGGMSYLSELLSYADIEKFDGTEKLILKSWKVSGMRKDFESFPAIKAMKKANDCHYPQFVEFSSTRFGWCQSLFFMRKTDRMVFIK
ncbi:DnaB-like helicase N-terminal domain-containing protein [Neobacillus rhizophilus]|uniref:DnaB-like helicase N-terminal domain-containing protein n=1 Tax=Neobacillus rhizophilus TaxID=2833579 RepID=UPI002016BB6F|nr:DnaB-like helicase N-terminal domain-containing protein [Neobacillus rhizophilus]